MGDDRFLSPGAESRPAGGSRRRIVMRPYTRLEDDEYATGAPQILDAPGADRS
ncbi:MAG: hypothetical protein IH587_10035 [Anaerolineae bacterium]|nr:hypothetical protein [Anaerolineae bacterium]